MATARHTDVPDSQLGFYRTLLC